ncbi:MAG: Zn-ribbon domain-containing OB-fold protein [Dehalococcoidia bacterium]|nr:Zn-ribbon domain-containing OB-fold protein [Dehalococcoidia bacterium]
MKPEIGMAKVRAPIPAVAGFRWSVGEQMERFIKALEQRRILGGKCGQCGYVYVPPRDRCGRCHASISEQDLTEIPGKGTLLSYTVAHVELDGSGNFRALDAPKVIGAIKLEGADSTIFMPVEKIEAEQLKVDMPVEVVWAEKTEGRLTDLRAFRPVNR